MSGLKYIFIKYKPGRQATIIETRRQKRDFRREIKNVERRGKRKNRGETKRVHLT